MRLSWTSCFYSLRSSLCNKDTCHLCSSLSSASSRKEATKEDCRCQESWGTPSTKLTVGYQDKNRNLRKSYLIKAFTSMRTQTLITDRYFSGKILSSHCSLVLCGGYTGWWGMLTCIQRAPIKRLIRDQLVAAMYGIYFKYNKLREARSEENNIGRMGSKGG